MKNLLKSQEIMTIQQESKWIDANIPQQNDFVEKLEEDGGAIMFLLLKSSKKLF